MIRKITNSIAAIVVCISVVAAMPASAQSSSGPTSQNGMSQHHRMQYQMMKDMTQEMGRMTEQMSKGELTPEQRKQMARRMALISTMMQRMSGLAARPAMRAPEWQKQMGEMRKQMDGMMSNPQMAPAG